MECESKGFAHLGFALLSYKTRIPIVILWDQDEYKTWDEGLSFSSSYIYFSILGNASSVPNQILKRNP